MSRMDLAILDSRHPADGLYYIDQSMFQALRMCWGWANFLRLHTELQDYRGQVLVTYATLRMGVDYGGRPDTAHIQELVAPWARHWWSESARIDPTRMDRERFRAAVSWHAMDLLAVRAIAEGRLPSSKLPCYPGAVEDLRAARDYLATRGRRLEFRA